MSKKKRPFRPSHTRKLRDTRIEGEPGYERKLASEIIRRWNAYNLGENKKLAIQKGLPTEYNRLALMAVSVFHLSHWRLDVTVSNYLLAV